MFRAAKVKARTLENRENFETADSNEQSAVSDRFHNNFQIHFIKLNEISEYSYSDC